jgi:hypothetical protein
MLVVFHNLTPHALVVRRLDGSEMVIPKSGFVARVAATYHGAEDAHGIPTVTREFGRVEGLPGPSQDLYYIVSAPVLSALKESGANRPDVLAPDTGDTVIRDEANRIMVRQFMR